MDFVDTYFEARKALYDAFGYVEQWRLFALEDTRSCFWKLDPFHSVVTYADTLEQVKEENGDEYSAEVYTYRHLKQYIYRTTAYTMILADTNTDGNILLMIFDNAKEVKEP